MSAPRLPLLIFLATVAFTLSGLCAQQEVRRAPLPGSAPGTERWIVMFKTRSFTLKELDDAARSKASKAAVEHIVARIEQKVREDQRDFVSFIEDLGGKVNAQWWIINACEVEVPRAKLDAVRAHKRVLRLQPVLPTTPARVCRATPRLPIKQSTDALNHNADLLHGLSIKGAGVTGAIVDTGLDVNYQDSPTFQPHMSFANRVLLARSYDPDLSADDISGSRGHGTAVAGVMLGDMWLTAEADRGHAPDAWVASYRVVDASGASNTSSMTTGWQQVKADAAVAANKIRVAVTAEVSNPSPMASDQMAADELALPPYDVLVVGAVGNDGNTERSPAFANGLAVGAVSGVASPGGHHELLSFSSRGPLPGDPTRYYPDLCANGESMKMPQEDHDDRNYVDNGTSFAAPQVAGAALLFRSVRTGANVLETKAAILATTESLADQNSEDLGRWDYGLGYLRDDWLVKLAQQQNNEIITTNTFSASNPSPHTVQVPMTAGKAYAAVIAWNRLDVQTTSWSNLDLEVRQGTRSVVSNSPRNLYEKVLFFPAATGSASVIVTAPSLAASSQDYALVVTEIDSTRLVEGAVTRFNMGSCMGRGGTKLVDYPKNVINLTSFGNSSTNSFFGHREWRHQLLYKLDNFTLGQAATGIAFRQDNTATIKTAFPLRVRIEIGYSTKLPAQMSNNPQANRDLPITTVVDRIVHFPAMNGANMSPGVFSVQIPFDGVTFSNQPPAGANSLLLEVVFDVLAGQSGKTYHDYRVDSVTGASGAVAELVVPGDGLLPNVAQGHGLAFAFTDTDTTVSIAPRLECVGRPETGSTFTAQIFDAPPFMNAAIISGGSNTFWGTTPLPLDLTPVGAPNCFLLVSYDSQLAFQTNVSGWGQFGISVPNDPALRGTRTYLQGVVFDPLANMHGAVYTSALELLIGGRSGG